MSAGERKTGASTADGFDAFVVASSPALMRAAVLLTGDRHRAEDLVQDALARTFLRWRHIDGDPFAYARRTLFNLYLDWWRRRPWRERPDDEAAKSLTDRRASSDDGLAEQQATTDTLTRALAALTKRERAVVVLRYYADLSEADIAQALGIAPGTVKSASARALAKLRLSPHLAHEVDLAETPSPGGDG